jgi:DNA replication protein DnaC
VTESVRIRFHGKGGGGRRHCRKPTYSNKPFSAWGEIFGDEATAVAMIDRLVHHAEILSLKGDSYRLRDKDLGTPARD